MKNTNILCCINDNPIFSYNPIITTENLDLDQIIINFLTGSNTSKRWIKKETTEEKNVKFNYYEINLTKAMEVTQKEKKYKNNSIENFCLSFSNLFLEKTPNKLISFLKKTQFFSEKELQEIEDYFYSKNKIERKK